MHKVQILPPEVASSIPILGTLRNLIVCYKWGNNTEKVHQRSSYWILLATSESFNAELA